MISGRKIRLQGHQASIICLEICSAFSIVVSGSEDGTAIIWDLNRSVLTFITIQLNLDFIQPFP